MMQEFEYIQLYRFFEVKEAGKVGFELVYQIGHQVGMEYIMKRPIPATQQWEYNIQWVKKMEPQDFNNMGLDGWELVQIVTNLGHMDAIAYFKRPLKTI